MKKYALLGFLLLNSITALQSTPVSAPSRPTSPVPSSPQDIIIQKINAIKNAQYKASYRGTHLWDQLQKILSQPTKGSQTKEEIINIYYNVYLKQKRDGIIIN